MRARSWGFSFALSESSFALKMSRRLCKEPETSLHIMQSLPAVHASGPRDNLLQMSTNFYGLLWQPPCQPTHPGPWYEQLLHKIFESGLQPERVRARGRSDRTRRAMCQSGQIPILQMPSWLRSHWMPWGAVVTNWTLPGMRRQRLPSGGPRGVRPIGDPEWAG